MADEPLGLTVHSLPQPHEAAASDAQRACVSDILASAAAQQAPELLMSFDNVRQYGVSLLASAGAAGLVIGQDHLAHSHDPSGVEEHVLGPAQPDPFGAERPRGAAIGQGNQEQQVLFGQGLTQYNQPLNTYNALMTGAQVQNPTFGNVAGVNQANTDVAGITNSAYQNQLARYNASQAGINNLFSLGGSLGAAAILA